MMDKTQMFNGDCGAAALARLLIKKGIIKESDLINSNIIDDCL